MNNKFIRNVLKQANADHNLLISAQITYYVHNNIHIPLGIFGNQIQTVATYCM